MRSNRLQLVFSTAAAFAGALVAPVSAAQVRGDQPAPTAVAVMTVEEAALPPEEARLRRLAAAAFEFARAKLYADSGEFDSALRGFQRSLELDDSDPYSLIELAEFHAYLAQISRSQRQQLGHLEAAADYAARARAVAADNLDVLRSYAQVHLRLVEDRKSVV